MSFLLKIVTISAIALLATGATTRVLAVDALSDARFAGFMQEADDFAIDSSNLALQKSDNAVIRDYATRTLAERREMSGALSKARTEAKVSHVTLPEPADGRRHQAAVLDRLNRLQGGAFDDAFTGAQIKAQTETIAQVSAYSMSGNNGNLRHFAQEALLKLEVELDGAKGLAAQ